MNIVIRTLAFAFLLLPAALGCAHPKVVQGTVVQVDTGTHGIVVRDELPPNAELRFDIADAELNAKPEAGDVVRIAYDQDGSTLRATRVMRLPKPKTPK
ncbi:MAG: hypothetical protein HY905_27600 [Deltaproteobacteria bacterium]|nr:hypothetical protein [Deltaproteobacteria bacterium]